MPTNEPQYSVGDTLRMATPTNPHYKGAEVTVLQIMGSPDAPLYKVQLTPEFRHLSRTLKSWLTSAGYMELAEPLEEDL